jgi:hypothetical protein
MQLNSFTKPGKSIESSDHYTSLYTGVICTSDNISQDQFGDLYDFVEKQKEQHPNHPALTNMLDSSKSGLLWNILNKQRWTTGHGEIAMLYHGVNVVGVSCVEKWDEHPSLTIGGIRCWLDKDHRTNQQMSTYLLAANYEWSQRRKAVGMLMSFNDYNKIIYDTIVRKKTGKTVGFARIWSNWWNDCLILTKPVYIRYTHQWCVIKPIDCAGCSELYIRLENNNAS